MLGSGSSKAGSLLKLMVYEDDVCLCILDSNPLSHGHSLIIPKCHFPSLEATPPPVPSKEQTNALSKELCSRSKVPDHVFKAINALPVAAHPMTQFANGVMALQVESEFQKAYDKGIPKAKFWEPTYDDCMNLVARLPVVASYVYRRLLVLSDPYLSFAAALNGLAGPLHGLANQEVLLWIKSVVEECGENITTEQLKDYVWKTLNSGKVVPGFGHGVLRKTDPRYTCQREFALKHLPDDPQIRICG